MEALRGRRAWAEDCGAVVDYSFHSGLTNGSEQTIAEMAEIVESGIATFKLFTVYREEGLYVDDAALFTIFREAARLGALPMVHAENERLVTWATQQLVCQGKSTPQHYPASRPRIAELEAARRAILLAKEAGSALYLVHVTSQEVAEEVGLERSRDYPIYGETCPHYLTLTEAVYGEKSGSNYVMSPPLRRREDNEALWNALTRGNLATVASDESSWHAEDKAKGQECFTQAPPGLVGVETRLSLAFSEGVQKGRLSINRFVELVATNPAKLCGLYPQKGIIAVGSDADIVLIDPDKRQSLDYQNLHHNAGYSPYQGWHVTGFPVTTICRGTVIVDNGELVASPGHGLFLKQSIDPAYLTSPAVS
jgi:dihydropyrimidinase